MRLTERRIALLGAFLGTFAAAYLLVDYVFGSGICLTGSGCDVVRSSPYAYPLGIPMPLLGLGFYLAAVGLLLVTPARRVGPASVGTLAVAWSLVGVGVMAILTFVELVVIGAVCSWCLLSAIASVVLATGAIGAWRRETGAPAVEGSSSRARRRRAAETDRSRTSLRRFAATSGLVVGIALVAILAIPPLVSGTPAGQADVDGADRPRVGAGPVEVVVYSDFQCPACAVAAPVLRDLADAAEITLVYRYFPLVSIHANATAAARAAQAASLQGRFWEFHDALFARQQAWAELPAAEAAAAFAAIAGDVGLDVDRWRTDATASAVADVVDADRRSAERLQLAGTPTIFIDGLRYGGRLDAASLLDAVRAAASAPAS
jgi:protein-disulfide isomerase/uncharacterized membrane protein